LQGEYKAIKGIVHGSSNTFFVVGSLLSIHDGVNMTDGGSYKCINPHHEQQSNGFCKMIIHDTAPDIDFVDPLIATNSLTCIPGDVGARPGVFVCANNRQPSTSTSISTDTKKLPIFCIVLSPWINDDTQTVIVPNEFKLDDMINGKHFQTTNSIWRCTGTDTLFFWQYRELSVADIQNWSEYSFNMKMGPFLSLSTACGIRDFFNDMFRDVTIRLAPKHEVLSDDSAMYVTIKMFSISHIQ
jgi:hypothetical protein